MIIAAVALGSNLGDRAGHLRFGFTRLAAVLQELRTSSTIETAPVGVSDAAGQAYFLNAAAVGLAAGSARDLLSNLLQIERDALRERPFPGAPRTLDLDLILFGSETIDEAGLQVPHPRFRERLFVLEPLAEIAPDLVDPVTRLTVRELRRSCKNRPSP